MRKRAKVDQTQKSIVDALRKVGCQVLSLAPLGNGAPDLLVRCGRFEQITDVGQGRQWGKYVLMEVKTQRGRLRPEQETFLASWPEVAVVRTPEDALQAIGVVKP